MYIPIEDDDDSEVERRMTRAEKKVRREREKREARKKVQEQVQHWVDFYAKSGKYFPVGRVVPEQEQEGEQGEKKELELCEAAKKQRPKRSKLREEKEKGASEGRDA